MKKAFNCLFLLIVLFGASSFAQTTIALLDLQGIGISKDETSLLTNRLRNELVKTKVYRVVERQEMSKILKEQKFQASGCTSTECAVEIGQLLGVERIVMGSIGILGNMYTISSRMVDVESAELISVSDYDYEGNITGLLKYGMKSVALELVGERKVEVISTQKELKAKKLDISSTIADEKGKSIKNINYNLKEQAFVTITIYDIVERKVAQLVNSVQEAGFKSVQWDATDSSGNPVSEGVYIYKLNVGENVQATKSFILTRETKTN